MLQKDLVVFSGAGLSAPSGIPTFRDDNGLWHNHKIDHVAEYTTWKQHRYLVHEFHNQRRRDLALVEPNHAHQRIAEWQRKWPTRTQVLTQNVDDLLERAGCTDVVHLHGSLHLMKCTACGHLWTHGLQDWNPDKDRCVKCNSARGVKPGTVFFNEHAPLYKDLYWTVKQLHENSMVVVIGTSGIVLDVQTLFGRTPAVKVLNNLEPLRTIDHSLFDHVFFESADTAVDKIDQLVQNHMEGSQS